VVLCDGEGLAIFDKLHSRTYDGEVSLYPFDLLELDGTDWRPRTLEERKHRLAELLANAPPGIQYGERLESDGAAIFAHACRLGAEGIVSKHREHPYRSGSSKIEPIRWHTPTPPAYRGKSRLMGLPNSYLTKMMNSNPATVQKPQIQKGPVGLKGSQYLTGQRPLLQLYGPLGG
jgi:hypothetical protein